METKLDLAAFVGSLMWPSIVLFVIWKYGHPIAMFCSSAILPRLKKLSLGSFSLELGEGKEMKLSEDPYLLSVLQGGSAAMVNDSTVRSFAAQVLAPGRADYAVLDLGAGQAWLTSRLYILAVVLRRMRGIQVFVFTQSDENSTARFVGVCDTDAIRWTLAERYPLYEFALAEAQSQIWRFASGIVPPIPNSAVGAKIVNRQGRMESAGAAGDHPAVILVREFLQRVQKSEPPGVAEGRGWQRLKSATTTMEWAEWVSAGWAEQLLAGAFSTFAIIKNTPDGEGESQLIRRLAAAQPKWAGIVDADLKFKSLVDTDGIARRVAQQCFGQSA